MLAASLVADSRKLIIHASRDLVGEVSRCIVTFLPVPSREFPPDLFVHLIILGSVLIRRAEQTSPSIKAGAGRVNRLISRPSVVYIRQSPPPITLAGGYFYVCIKTP